MDLHTRIVQGYVPDQLQGIYRRVCETQVIKMTLEDRVKGNEERRLIQEMNGNYKKLSCENKENYHLVWDHI